MLDTKAQMMVEISQSGSSALRWWKPQKSKVLNINQWKACLSVKQK